MDDSKIYDPAPPPLPPHPVRMGFGSEKPQHKYQGM